MAKTRSVTDGWVPIRHGIPSSYTRGCRCDTCRAGHAARQRSRGYGENHRNRNYAQRVLVTGRWVHPNPAPGHGTRDSYMRFGCRCDQCREARRNYDTLRLMRRRTS